jgi:hypothetical protein
MGSIFMTEDNLTKNMPVGKCVKQTPCFETKNSPKLLEKCQFTCLCVSVNEMHVRV